MNYLPDFSYYPDFITAMEEKKIIQELELLNWQSVVLFGQIAKRRVVHLGMDYHYERRTVQPTKLIPEFLNTIKDRSAHLLGVKPEEIVEALITEYPINAGIGWHRDAGVFELICGISLNSPTVIQFRNRDNHQEQRRLILEPRSAYILSGRVRWHWDHRITPVKKLRYSITFRTLKSNMNKV